MGNERFWTSEYIGRDRARDIANIGSGIYLREFVEKDAVSNGCFCCFFCLEKIVIGKKAVFVGIPLMGYNGGEVGRRVIYLDIECYHLARLGEFSRLIDTEPDER